MKISAVELAGKLLRVNLSTGAITTEELGEDFVRKYVGGGLLGIKLLYDEVKTGVEPFDPENKLIFTTGIVTGTNVPGTCLFNIATKGPLTGLAASAQANGYFGLRLKQAGFGTIVVEGQSDTWKYLVIANGKAELRDAEHLRGKNTMEAERMIKEEVGGKNMSVVTIGPGGENLVRFANIQADAGHFASSNGPGAVMGSKKLKGIAAFGEYRIEPADPEKFRASVKEFVNFILNAPPAMGLSQFGTGMLIPIAYKIGYLPTRNLSKYDWPQNEIYDNVKLKKNPAYEFKKNPCFACPIGHCKDMIFKEGKYKGKVIDEPEYEAWQGFSGLIGVTDVDETAMLATLNDELGLDLKEMCYTLAWAIECYEKGYLTKKDTDGLELTWGNVEAIRELMHKIALREGFGAILAEGVMRASKRYGGPAADCAVYCKRGAAPHIHDPRGNYSVALAQAFSENGSIYGAVDRSPNPEMGYPEGVPFTDSEAHPILLARGTWKVAFQDIYMICNFAAINYPLMFECLNALTGWNVDEEEGKQMGYRMATLARAYNILQGAKAEEDTLSKKLLDPIADGPNKGKSLGLVIDDARKKYYKEMGWNEETSYPLPETLRKYDLEYVMKDLY